MTLIYKKVQKFTSLGFKMSIEWSEKLGTTHGEFLNFLSLPKPELIMTDNNIFLLPAGHTL